MPAPTVINTNRGRLHTAQPSGILMGQEDTQFAFDIALLEKYTSPVTLITMKMKRARSRTIDVHWFEDQYLPNIDQINNQGTAYDSSSTILDVDHGEYFASGDTVRDPLTDEVMLVDTISSDALTVIRDFGQSTEGWTALADALADNAYLQILANAFEPGHPLPTYKHTQPVELTNYCQDVRTPIQMSEVQDATKQRTGSDMQYQTNKSRKEHMWKIEYQNIWGKPYRGDRGNYNSTTRNVNPPTGGGINHYISTNADADHLIDQIDLTEWEFLDALEIAFDKGSKEKLLICTSNLRTAFSKWGITRENTFVNTKVLGMDISKWQTSDGILFILTHNMLKRNSTSEYYYNFILDMSDLRWLTLGEIGSTSLRKAGNHETTGETLTSKEFQTISCIEVKNANHHVRLRYKTVSI